MFAKREWLKTLCTFVVLGGAMYNAYKVAEEFKKDTSAAIITLIISIIAYYIAYRLALFYKARKDKKLDSI